MNINQNEIVGKMQKMNSDKIIDKNEAEFLRQMLEDKTAKEQLASKLKSNTRLKLVTKQSFENSISQLFDQNLLSDDDIVLFQTYCILYLGREQSEIQWGKICSLTKKLMDEQKLLMSSRIELPATKLDFDTFYNSFYKSLALYENQLSKLDSEKVQDTTIGGKIGDGVAYITGDDGIGDLYEKNFSKLQLNLKGLNENFDRLSVAFDQNELTQEQKSKISLLKFKLKELRQKELQTAGLWGATKNTFQDVDWAQTGVDTLEFFKGAGKGLYDSTLGFFEFLYKVGVDENARGNFMEAMKGVYEYLSENYDQPGTIMKDILNKISIELKKLNDIDSDRKPYVIGEIIGNVVGAIIGVKGLSKVKNAACIKVVKKVDNIDGLVSGGSLLSKNITLGAVRTWDDLEHFCRGIDRIRFTKGMSGEKILSIVKDIKKGNFEKINELPRINGLQEKVRELIEFGEVVEPGKVAGLVDKVAYAGLNTMNKGIAFSQQIIESVINQLPKPLAESIYKMAEYSAKFVGTGIDVLDKAIGELSFVIGNSLGAGKDVILSKIMVVKKLLSTVEYPYKLELMAFLDQLTYINNQVFEICKKPLNALKDKTPYHYEGGMAISEKTGKYGFYDHNKKLVIPEIYDKVSAFNNGKAIVSKDGKSYIINKKGENLLAGYTSPEKITGEFDKVQQIGKNIYLLENAGDVNIVKIIDELAPDGTTIGFKIEQHASLDTSGFTQIGGNFNSIKNKDGYAIVSKDYDVVVPFSNPVDHVEYLGEKILKCKRGTTDFLIIGGNEIPLLPNDRVLQVFEGQVLLQKKTGKVLLNKNGDNFLKVGKDFCGFEYIDKKRGIAIVKNNDGNLCLTNISEGRLMKIKDIDAKKIISLEDDLAIYFDGRKYYSGKVTKEGIQGIQELNFSSVRNNKGVLIGTNRDGKETVINLKKTNSGNLVRNELGTFDKVDEFYNDVALVSVDGEYGLLHTNGKFVPNCKLGDYKRIYSSLERDLGLNKGLYLVEKNNKFGIIDHHGNQIVPVVYDEMSVLQKGVIKTTKNGKIGSISSDGNILFEAEYYDIKSNKQGMLEASNGQNVVTTDPTVKIMKTSFLRGKDLAFMTLVQEGLSILKKNKVGSIIDRESSQIVNHLRSMKFSDMLESFNKVGSQFNQEFQSILLNIATTGSWDNAATVIGNFLQPYIDGFKNLLKQEYGVKSFSDVEIKAIGQMKREFAALVGVTLASLSKGESLPCELGNCEFVKQMIGPVFASNGAVIKGA